MVGGKEEFFARLGRNHCIDRMKIGLTQREGVAMHGGGEGGDLSVVKRVSRAVLKRGKRGFYLLSRGSRGGGGGGEGQSLRC